MRATIMSIVYELVLRRLVMDRSGIAVVIALAVVFFIVLVVNRRKPPARQIAPVGSDASAQPITPAPIAPPAPVVPPPVIVPGVPPVPGMNPTPRPDVEDAAFDDEPTRGIGDRLREAVEEQDEFEGTTRGGTSMSEPLEPQAPMAIGGASDLLQPPEPAEFTAYYPKEIAPSQWYDLLAYVYRQSASAQVDADAKGELGDQAKLFRRAARPASATIIEDASIMVTPRMTGFQFNPVSATIGFYDAWNRAAFKLRASSAAPGEVHEGVITFTVEGIIVCEIPLFIDVSTDAATMTPIANKPTAQAETRKVYQAVFCSYSRQDLHIVERVERAYKILGFDYLRDLTTIRAGENWDDRLNQMIESADIFQLFWSANSATSSAVRKEWTKALEIAQSRPNFIRPVFWQEPLPAPPRELGAINFVYEPTLDD